MKRTGWMLTLALLLISQPAWAARLAVRYSDAVPGSSVRVEHSHGDVKDVMQVTLENPAGVEAWRL